MFTPKLIYFSFGKNHINFELCYQVITLAT
jgi:hypothetical protein